jgi:inosine-uridine nucleoside N-ribohydrolase
MKFYSVIVFVLVSTSTFGAQPKRVLLDVDPGIDDTMAILLALRSPELQVEGITVVAGNVPVDQGVVNTLKILELAGRGDIPVARGAAQPLLGKLTTSKHVHGENGMGDVELPAPDLKPYEGTAIDLIVSKVEQHPGEITLIPVGPLTNIAMFLRFRPDLASQIC